MWFSSWFRLLKSFSRSARGGRASNRKQRRRRLHLEPLESRWCPDAGTIDPAVLATFGDAYTGVSAVGPAAPLTTAPVASGSTSTASSPATPSAIQAAANTSSTNAVLSLASASPDPGAPGPYAVTYQEYNFGDTAFQPS